MPPSATPSDSRSSTSCSSRTGSPIELQRSSSIQSNLLAHHLDVLERVGLISRTPLQRRRAAALRAPAPRSPRRPATRARGCRRAGAVRLHAATRRARSSPPPCGGADRRPAGLGGHPPGRAGPPRSGGRRTPGRARPRAARHRVISTSSTRRPALVVTVCDRAHEEAAPTRRGCTGRCPTRSRSATPAAFDADGGRAARADRLRSLAKAA